MAEKKEAIPVSKPKLLDEMTTIELKAHGYDMALLMTQVQNEINAINAELQKRGQQPAPGAK